MEVPVVRRKATNLRPQETGVDAVPMIRPSVRWIEKVGEPVLQYLLPAPCLACGIVEGGRALPLGLCLVCRGQLVRSQPPGCTQCARHIPLLHVPEGFRCARCRARPLHFDRLLVPWLYQAPMDAVIHGLKFGRLEYLGRHLACSLINRFGRDLKRFEVVVPVPLHWLRRAQRGYNQAECIARALSVGLGVPLVRGLRRSRSTARQARLPREERIRNPQRAFRYRRCKALVGRSVLLVDDVVTTGATLDAAARRLREAGCREVWAAVAARTPASDEAIKVRRSGQSGRRAASRKGTNQLERLLSFF